MELKEKLDTGRVSVDCRITLDVVRCRMTACGPVDRFSIGPMGSPDSKQPVCAAVWKRLGLQHWQQTLTPSNMIKAISGRRRCSSKGGGYV